MQRQDGPAVTVTLANTNGQLNVIDGPNTIIFADLPVSV
jgi:hypothetical protein